MNEDIEKAIKALTEKSTKSLSHEALHYTQASLNLAHTLQVIKQISAENK